MGLLTELFNRGKGETPAIKTRSQVDLSGSRNIFGSIANNQLPISTGMSFIPIDGSGRTFDVDGGSSPKWIGLATRANQYWAYNFCSPLAAVIDRLAEADTNGRIKLIDSEGNIKTNFSGSQRAQKIMTLLNKPNPLQTWEEFNSQQVVLCKIFGYCPVFAVGSTGMDKSNTKSLWNLNPFFCQPQFDYKFSMFDEEANPIKSWLITIFGTIYNIDSSDILLIKDGYIDNTIPNMGLPLSKVAGLDFFVSNICAAMEADNVLLKKKGPLGVWSYNAKPDMAGMVPMTPEEKTDLQSDLDQYGLTVGQLQHIVSKVPVKFEGASFNLRDLMTKETVRQGIDGICDRFGYPAELMSGKNATYENRNSAEKFLYQNNIIPFSLRRMSRYNDFFGLTSMNLSLFMDYSYLPVLQDDIQKAGEARKALSESLTLDWTNGMITWNQYLILLKLPPVDTGNIYVDEYNKKMGRLPTPETVTA